MNRISRLRRAFFCVAQAAACAFALTVAALPASAAAGDESTAAPVVASCSNPSLPDEILDGTVATGAAKPLRVVDATAPDLSLRLAVADDEVDREQGLMCVTRLKPQHGMIFVFQTSRQWEFWMKDTLVPLDMVWVTEGGDITTIAENVPASTRETPDDKIARRSGTGKYVIELAAGEAAADKLKVGERLKLPSLRTSQ